MKIMFDTPVRIGDKIYKLKFHKNELITDIYGITSFDIHGFSIYEDGVWIDYFGYCVVKLKDLNKGIPDDCGFAYFSSFDKASEFVKRNYHNKPVHRSLPFKIPKQIAGGK